MTILMKFPMDEREFPGDPDKLALETFARAKSAYDDVSDSEVYLRRLDPCEECRAAELLDFHDGAAEPEYVVALATGWNGHVEQGFDAALARLQAGVKLRPDGTRAWLDCASMDIYELKKAAMALDDHVYDFAERALLANKYQYLAAVLRPEELQEIKDRPGDYVVLKVYPK